MSASVSVGIRLGVFNQPLFVHRGVLPSKSDDSPVKPGTPPFNKLGLIDVGSTIVNWTFWGFWALNPILLTHPASIAHGLSHPKSLGLSFRGTPLKWQNGVPFRCPLKTPPGYPQKKTHPCEKGAIFQKATRESGRFRCFKARILVKVPRGEELGLINVAMGQNPVPPVTSQCPLKETKMSATMPNGTIFEPWTPPY